MRVAERLYRSTKRPRFVRAFLADMRTLGELLISLRRVLYYWPLNLCNCNSVGMFVAK